MTDTSAPTSVSAPAPVGIKVFASLCIYGDDVHRWSSLLGINPDSLLPQGEERVSRSGKSVEPRPLGAWLWSTENRVVSDTLDDHVRYLVAQAGLPRRELANALVSASSWGMVLVFHYGPEDEAEFVNPALLEAIQQSGLEWHVDHYQSNTD